MSEETTPAPARSRSPPGPDESSEPATSATAASPTPFALVGVQRHQQITGSPRPLRPPPQPWRHPQRRPTSRRQPPRRHPPRLPPPPHPLRRSHRLGPPQRPRRLTPLARGMSDSRLGVADGRLRTDGPELIHEGRHGSTFAFTVELRTHPGRFSAAQPSCLTRKTPVRLR